MYKYPSIDQFRNTIRAVKAKAQYAGRDENGDAVYNPAYLIPKLKFRGTVKLHGTNAGIAYDCETSEITYQSRERELSLISDNAGFMLYMENHKDTLLKLFNHCKSFVMGTSYEKIVVFGEWCGKGIQSGVAISQLDKMFVIFGIKVIVADEGQQNIWLPVDRTYPEARIFNIFQFPSWEVDIDFNHPELIQNHLGELTEAVEAECPVGKHFGVSGIGEGIVWSCITEGWRSSDFMFKVKGEKHSVSKVKTLASVDVEAVTAPHDFVQNTVTEARLEQGLQNLINEQQKPFEMSSLGDFIRWVYNDVIKEESDTIVASQLDPKKLGSAVANAARPWFIKRFNQT